MERGDDLQQTRRLFIDDRKIAFIDTPPSAINTRGNLSNTLGSSEWETTALWICLFCQTYGYWVSFSVENILAFYYHLNPNANPFYITQGIPEMVKAGLLEELSIGIQVRSEFVNLLQKPGDWRNKLKIKRL